MKADRLFVPGVSQLNALRNPVGFYLISIERILSTYLSRYISSQTTLELHPYLQVVERSLDILSVTLKQIPFILGNRATRTL